MKRPVAAALAFAALLTTGAGAQTPVQPQPRDPNMPSPQNVPPEKVDPAPGGSTGTLSDRLERSDGVIRPAPSVDGGMVRPTPDTGATTPVIPPAGTPGSARPNADPR